jgi:hypothetical protein
LKGSFASAILSSAKRLKLKRLMELLRSAAKLPLGVDAAANVKYFLTNAQRKRAHLKLRDDVP